METPTVDPTVTERPSAHRDQSRVGYFFFARQLPKVGQKRERRPYVK